MSITVGEVTITPQYTVADLADVMVEKFSPRIAPLSAYKGAMYGNDFRNPMTGAQRLYTLHVAIHAVSLLGSKFNSTFEHRRLANNALTEANHLLNDDLTDAGQKQVLAGQIADLARVVANTYGD